ncbi:MAG: universal stress protein [Pseudomonadota bacterium]
MYKHVVVATDGSEIAGKALDHAIALAKGVGAALTAVTITEPFESIAFTEQQAVVDPKGYEQQCEVYAETVLDAAVSKAQAAGVTIKTAHHANRWPYAGIIDAAQKADADLIVLGSHGRRGLEALLLGSQAVKVLTHTKIPVLVVR